MSTPLPWKAESITTLEPGEQRATLRIIGSIDNNVGGELVCDLNEGWGNHSENGELIVHAVNSHADLLAACKGALFALGECVVGREKLCDLFPVKVEALRVAIAKAEGTS